MKYTAKVVKGKLVVTGSKVGLLEFIYDCDAHENRTHGYVLIRTKTKVPVGVAAIGYVSSCDICECDQEFTHVGLTTAGIINPPEAGPAGFCTECYLKSMIESYGELKLELVITPCLNPQKHWEQRKACEDCTGYDCVSKFV